MYDELSVHPVMSILDDDVSGMVGRVLRGVEITDDTLALKLIKEVGPIPGQFLSTTHTRDWWKKEWFMPKVADRLSYDAWIQRE
jgi:trimethylamine--corrinoid protein Co-methyltransferase